MVVLKQLLNASMMGIRAFFIVYRLLSIVMESIFFI